MMMRAVLFCFLLVIIPATVWAEEKIRKFDVEISVVRSGDIAVAESITIIAEGQAIRRGIFRDLPRYYTNDGVRFPYRYDVQSVTRNGRKEPYDIQKTGNAYRIRIGDADVFLDSGQHTYEIVYGVKNQIRYFDNYDELYWNVTGAYWAFPIDEASAKVTLPGGAGVIQTAGYTGGQGATGRAYQYRQAGDAHIFTATQPLARKEGMTIALGFAKGVIDPPSAADRRGEWWARHGSLVTLVLAALGLVGYYFYSWTRVGRDPLKGPVFARYEPPADYSPAAVHQIFFRKLSGHGALIASLMNLAIHKKLMIDAKDKKKTGLSLLEGAPGMMSEEEEKLLASIFSSRKSLTLGARYDALFTSAYRAFQQRLSRAYGSPYFRWNTQFLILGVIVTVLSIVIASSMIIEWTLYHKALIVGLLILLALFSYFIPAPTPKGQKIRTEIEGFRLYLETAEKLHLNAVTPGSNAPPPMSTARYEKFLPYAVALGVEEPWTKHFERLIPQEAENYNPGWTHFRGGRHQSLAGLNRSLISSMSSGVTSAMPQSSSSSGSSGGGFSGGGGGGGGGGGW